MIYPNKRTRLNQKLIKKLSILNWYEKEEQKLLQEQQQPQQQTTNNFPSDPFITYSVFWQNIMSNWMSFYDEYVKNIIKFNGLWFDKSRNVKSGSQTGTVIFINCTIKVAKYFNRAF